MCLLGVVRQREEEKGSATGEGERVRAGEKHGRKEGGRGNVCATQCLHAKMNRVEGEPCVMLQEHSSGLGGWALHQQMDKPERRMHAKRQMYQRLAGA